MRPKPAGTQYTSDGSASAGQVIETLNLQRQFAGAQRNHDMIKTLRDRAHAVNQAKTDDSA